jgi:hypothetical protein
MKKLGWILVFLAACSSSDGTQPNPPSGANVYYLNFEGQALTAGPDDPVLNQSQIINSTVTFPAYLAGDPQRVSKIQAIVAEVQQVLAPYDIAVVTARPSSGTYDMLVAGGASQQAGLSTGLPGDAVVDCAKAVLRHISLLFDLSTGHDAVRQIIGGLGVSHGISASTASTDCMCIADGTCTILAAACTIGGPNTPVSANANCELGGANTTDEHQAFLAEFGAHP